MALADDSAPPMRAPVTGARDRSSLGAVAVPSEHGGWGLTIEPVVLGLLVAPSWAGVMIGVATVSAFLARTPVKIVLVDRHRGRWLERSRVALAVSAVELAVMATLVAFATVLAGWSWWVPVLVAAPMIVVELWYDARSRSRRLVPELLGAVGVAASVASIVLAGAGGHQLAAGAWVVLAARAIGSIPFVRAQIGHLRRGDPGARVIVAAQAASVSVGAVAVACDSRLTAGFAAIVALALFQLAAGGRPPTSVKALGVTQMVLGFALVLVTGVGVALA